MHKYHTTGDVRAADEHAVVSRRLSSSKSKSVAIVQSNYIPWKGYFDIINMVDEFILFDDVQYTRRDWRNRNQIKTPQGLLWLSIPVQAKGNYHQHIKDIVISHPGWNREHWKTIAQHYAQAKWFESYRERLEKLYCGGEETHLSRINHRFLVAICEMLGIKTRITWSMDYPSVDGKTERLVDLCKQAGATEYLSGPAAKDYIKEELFAEAGLRLRWMDYSGYAEYEQLFGPFEHNVSVIDLILNKGPDAPRYLKSFDNDCVGLHSQR